MNHQAILKASRTLCTYCRRCTNPEHADSRRKFCARHERDYAAQLLRTDPYCMMVQTELALWQSRAIALGQLSIDELVAQ